MEYRILLFPFIGAAIGWFTNYIAVKMLFRPYKPINILGYKFQGLIPKRRKEIAKSIAKTIERELLSASDLTSVLEKIDWEEEVEKTVEEVIEHQLKGSTIKKFPIVGILSDNILYHLKFYLTKEMNKFISTKKKGFFDKFHKKIDLREMVTNRIDGLDLSKFEKLLQELIARELKHIEWIGGLLGFIIGSVQVVIYFILR